MRRIRATSRQATTPPSDPPRSNCTTAGAGTYRVKSITGYTEELEAPGHFDGFTKRPVAPDTQAAPARRRTAVRNNSRARISGPTET